MSDNLRNLGQKIAKYCDKWAIPIQYVFEILEDQKVTPMIRGKAMEYNAYILLDVLLPKSTWSVQKLNLNAQPGAGDEDISITHRRSGVILKVESKSAVRGSISLGTRSRIMKAPHFNVKCHRSRSNIKLAQTSNDRYAVDCFDVIMTNSSNAIFEGNTVGDTLEVVQDPDIRKTLYKHYKVERETELIKAAASDWRFCIPKDIAIDGYIPRTPYVNLLKDPSWKPMVELEHCLLQVVEEKRKSISRRNLPKQK